MGISTNTRFLLKFRSSLVILFKDFRETLLDENAA
jgi:hypothetical protein